MRRVIAIIVFFTIPYVLPAPARAQASREGELGVSYSFLRFLEGDNFNLPAGWLVSASGPVGDWLAIVGEVAGNYKKYDDGGTLSLYTFQGGVRVSAPWKARPRPFGQFVLGATHLRSDEGGGNVATDTRFSIEPGGGVDLPIRDRLAARVAVGFPMFFVEGEVAHSVRVQAGVVFDLGGR